jgi:hypothetical protein
MIHHLSIAVRNPAHVAEVLANILEGKATPFPPNPGSHVVFNLDEYGTLIELYPHGTELKPGETDTAELQFTLNPQASGYKSTHAAISVKVDEAKIREIAETEGWRLVKCDRDGAFEVLEFWLENEVLLELLTPELATKYLAFTQPESLQKFFTEVATANLN